MRKPDEFAGFPRKLHPGFGPYPAITRWDKRYDDGDTLWFFIDKGFNDYEFKSIRFWGVDAPERGDYGGLESRDFLFDLLPYNTPVRIHTEKDPDQYGRYIGAILYGGAGDVLRCVNLDLVKAGHATPRDDYGYQSLLKLCRFEGVTCEGIL